MVGRYGEKTRAGQAVSTFGRNATVSATYKISGGTYTSYPTPTGTVGVVSFTSPGTLSVTGKTGLCAMDVLVVGGGEPGGSTVLPGYPTLVQPGFGGEGGAVNSYSGPGVGFTGPGSFSVTVGTATNPSSIAGTPYTAAGSSSNPFAPAPRSVQGAPVGPLTDNGGGAGAGGNAPGTPRGTAGPGVSNSFRTGSAVTYGAGGAAGVYTGLTPGAPAPANSGGGGTGGNGGPGSGTYTGGTGASGIVVVRFPVAVANYV